MTQFNFKKTRKEFHDFSFNFMLMAEAKRRAGTQRDIAKNIHKIYKRNDYKAINMSSAAFVVKVADEFLNEELVEKYSDSLKTGEILKHLPFDNTMIYFDDFKESITVESQGVCDSLELTGIMITRKKDVIDIAFTFRDEESDDTHISFTRIDRNGCELFNKTTATISNIDGLMYTILMIDILNKYYIFDEKFITSKRVGDSKMRGMGLSSSKKRESIVKIDIDDLTTRFINDYREKNQYTIQNEFDVRGHWRHYKSGKKTWIPSYTKGKGKPRKETSYAIEKKDLDTA